MQMPLTAVTARDIDLKLIDALWQVQAGPDQALRASDRQAVRQAADALDSLGRRLVAALSEQGARLHRSRPEITPYTRIRTVPNRLWLELRFTDDADPPSDLPVLFLQIDRTGVDYGLFARAAPGDPEGQSFWKSIKKSAPRVFKRLKRQQGKRAKTGADSGEDWKVSRLAPPDEQVQGTADINAWLHHRTEFVSDAARALAISKSIGADEPTFEDIAERLADAARQFNLALAGTGRVRR